MVTKVLYGAVSATADNVITFDIVAPTTLVGIQWAINFDSVTDNSRLELMLSSESSSQFAVNNINDVLSVVAASVNLLTSGMYPTGINMLVPCMAPFKSQDRLALHALVSGTITARVYIVCHFSR